MVATIVLGGLLLAATITDVRWRKVYNWTTYPGAIGALVANGMATAWGVDLESSLHDQWGLVGLPDSLAGCLGCGCVMLACYVFFTGGVGGGDVKLLAMVGAFLGPWRGLEALLWTFVLSACVAILLLVWRLGAWRLLLRTVQSVAHLAIFRSWPPLRGEEREQLKTDVFLSPSALVAVLIVQLQLSKWF